MTGPIFDKTVELILYHLGASSPCSLENTAQWVLRQHKNINDIGTSRTYVRNCLTYMQEEGLVQLYDNMPGEYELTLKGYEKNNVR